MFWLFKTTPEKLNNNDICRLRALTLYLYGIDKLGTKAPKLLAAYLQSLEDVDAAKF